MDRKQEHRILAVAAVLAAYAVMMAAGITCPIKFLTGVSCAGCGMTRAWFSLLRLDFAAAYQYHPLFWVPPAALILYLLRKRIPEPVQKGLLVTACTLILAVYLFRMGNPQDTVVVFCPEEGLAAIALQKLAALFPMHTAG